MAYLESLVIKMLTRIVQYTVLTLIVLIIFIPLSITIFAAFKTPFQLGSDFPLKPPSGLYLDNFATVFREGHFFQGFKNSLILVVTSVAINALLGAMVTYCLVRFDFKLKKGILALFLLGMVIPTYITEITRFGIIHNLGLYNSLSAPIVIYAASDLVQIFIFMQFMEKIPKELDESAMIDGSSYFGIFFRMILPLLLPAIVTMGIIKAVDVTNDMYIPYLYMPSGKLRTLTTTLMYFNSTQTGSWSIISAAIVVIAIPTVLIYVIFQKHIFAGMTAGAVKG